MITGAERPQHGAVGEVDQAITIRPDQRHLAGGLDQLGLGALPAIAELAVAGGKTGDAAGADSIEPAHGFGRRRARRRQEYRVRRLRQILDRGVTAHPAEGLTARIDAPDRAVELRGALARAEIGVATADEGDMSR